MMIDLICLFGGLIVLFVDVLVMVLLVDDQMIVVEVVWCVFVDEEGIDFYYCLCLDDVMVIVIEMCLIVILQDFVMLGIDGLSFVKVYCVNLVMCDVLIIVLLMQEELVIKSVVFVFGVNDYLVKLFDCIEFVVCICYYLCLYLNLLQCDEVYCVLW